MRYIFLIWLFWVMITGCSPRTAPVSSTFERTESLDSVRIVTTHKSDSTTHRETLTEKIIPKATVGVSLSKGQLDSLVMALKAMPSSTPRAVYYQDPQTRAMLSLLLDSIGNLQVNCTALEMKYYEKLTEHERIIRDLSDSLSSYKSSTSVTDTEVREVKDPWYVVWWRKISQSGFVILIIALVIVAIFVGARLR